MNDTTLRDRGFSARVFLKQPYHGGDGRLYRRGIIKEVLEDGTLVILPVTRHTRIMWADKYNTAKRCWEAQQPPEAMQYREYYTTIDCKQSEVKFEDPLPRRERD